MLERMKQLKIGRGKPFEPENLIQPNISFFILSKVKILNVFCTRVEF
jgi:hypothetical protein